MTQILFVKQWPAAQQWSELFDSLRRGALQHFREGFPDVETSIEARQLKDLVFRDNADVLYAREQRLTATNQPTDEVSSAELELDPSAFGENLDFLDLFNFSDAPDLNFFGTAVIEEEAQMPLMIKQCNNSAALDGVNLTVSESPLQLVESEAQVKAALQRLPVCSRFKRRRVRCDLKHPSCRSCVKVHQECVYWDKALSEETSRM